MKRTYGALILAGGTGRRMGGKNKALLQLENRTFLSRLEEALSDFDEKLISVGDASWLANSGFSPVQDQVPGRGPLEGLRCALSLCRSDALLVVPCDVPLFSSELARALIGAGEGYDAVVCRDHSGHLHPLCGIYSKQCLSAIGALISQEDYKVSNIMKMVRGTTFSFAGSDFSDSLLANVNTPGALEVLRQNCESALL